MPTHPTAVRNSVADLVTDLIDVGSTNPTGSLVLLTAGDVEVATLAFSNPAFGAAVAGVATAAAIADDASAAGGVTTKCTLVDRDNNIIVQGTVGTSGTDIILSSATIPAAAVVEITALTYTAPA